MRPVVKSSTIVAACKQSAMLRCNAAREQRRRSGRGGKNAARGPRAAGVGTLVPFQPHQKAIRQHDRHSMPVEARPESALILVPAQEFLGLFMVLLYPTAAVSIFDHDGQGCVGGEVTPVVF